MQKKAAQVGDKKLIKLRLYRQTESSTRRKTESESGRGARERGIAGLSTHGSVSVKCRVLLLPGQAWAVVGVAQVE